MDFWSATIMLILVLDPLGNVPVCLALTGSLSPQRRNWVIVRENLIAWLTLVAFLLFGPWLLRTLGITDPALGFAGGAILFLIALRMMFNPPHRIMPTEQHLGEPLVVPLAIPLIAGPSAIAIVTLLVSTEPQRWLTWLGAITLASAVTLMVFLASQPLHRILGQRGLLACQRFMGILLLIIAVQMLIDAFETYWLEHLPALGEG